MGQRAYVTADAFHEVQFWGRVVRVGQVLGKKNIRTDEPAERVETQDPRSPRATRRRA